MSFHSFGFLLLASLFTVTVQADQTCRSNFEESTPTSRFVFSDNGTVTDTETEITWMRCAMGQKWDGKTCTGKAQEYSWQEAMDAVAELNSDTFGEPGSWRLPYVPELASIVERQCFEPRVNLTVFPATPSKAFWTSMEKKGNPEQAYAIDFGQGQVASSKKTYVRAIRLMHDGPNGKWWKMNDTTSKGS
jgi:hypothetical protein